jgi:hypothetical protein
MAAGVSEDTSVQPYQYEAESDPEQDGGPEEVRQLRLEQDVSKWLVNVMSLTLIYLCMYWQGRVVRYESYVYVSSLTD